MESSSHQHVNAVLKMFQEIMETYGCPFTKPTLLTTASSLASRMPAYLLDCGCAISEEGRVHLHFLDSGAHLSTSNQPSSSPRTAQCSKCRRPTAFAYSRLPEHAGLALQTITAGKQRAAIHQCEQGIQELFRTLVQDVMPVLDEQTARPAERSEERRGGLFSRPDTDSTLFGSSSRGANSKVRETNETKKGQVTTPPLPLGSLFGNNPVFSQIFRIDGPAQQSQTTQEEPPIIGETQPETQGGSQGETVAQESPEREQQQVPPMEEVPQDIDASHRQET